MVSKLTICCLILITLSTIVWTQKSKARKQQKRIEILQNTMKKTNQKIIKAFPKRMNAKQKIAARKLLNKYIKDWNSATASFKRGADKKISKRDWKELKKEFDKTVKSVEVMLNRRKRLFNLSPMEMIQNTIGALQYGIKQIVGRLKRFGEKTVGVLITWLGRCNDSGTNFLQGVENLFNNGGDDNNEDYTNGNADDTDPDDDDDNEGIQK